MLKCQAQFSCASSDDFYIQFRGCPLAYGKCLGPNWCCRVSKVIEQIERVFPPIALLCCLAMLPQCVVACRGGWGVLYQSDWLDCRRGPGPDCRACPSCPQAPPVPNNVPTAHVHSQKHTLEKYNLEKVHFGKIAPRQTPVPNNMPSA